MSIKRLFYEDTLIYVSCFENHYTLCIDYDGKPASVREVTRRWPELLPLEKYFASYHDTSTIISPDMFIPLREDLNDLMQICGRFKKISFSLEKSFKEVRVQDIPPDDFVLDYYWSNGCLCLKYPEGTDELEAGYYKRGNVYWANSSLSAMDQVKIRRKTIGKDEILEFLWRDLVAYAAAGIRYKCELIMDTIPAIEFFVAGVEQERVIIQRKWVVPPEQIDADFDIDGYVVAGRTLRPGIRPNSLDTYIMFDNNNVAILRGLQIPKFLDNGYKVLKPWFLRGTEDFEKTHKFIEPMYDWILTAFAVQAYGIGHAVATPAVLIGDNVYSVDEVISLMKTSYAHLNGCWVRRSDLYTLGLNEKGDWTGAVELAEKHLTAAQVIYQGDENLTGPWKRMVMTGAEWCTSPAKQRCANEHLSFLIHWGISGGIVGGYEACALYGNQLLHDLFSHADYPKVLVAGTDADIQDYESLTTSFDIISISEYAGSNEKYVYTARFDNMDEVTAAGNIQWDIVIYIEPDVFLGNAGNSQPEAFSEIPATISLVFSYKAVSEWNDQSVIAMMRITKLDKNTLDLLIQNPRSPRSRPDSYKFCACPVVPANPAKDFLTLDDDYIPTAETDVKAPVLRQDLSSFSREASAESSNFQAQEHNDSAVNRLADDAVAQTADTPPGVIQLGGNNENLPRTLLNYTAASASDNGRVDTNTDRKQNLINLDSETVRKLRDESDEVRETLIASIAENDDLPPEPDETPERPPDTPAELLTDLAPVSRILSGLSATQKRLLEKISSGGSEMSTAKLARLFPGVLLEMEIDEINALSIQYLGVQLIREAEDAFVLDSDYADEVEFLLDKSQEISDGNWQIDTQGLEDNWVNFFDTVDVQALGALLEGGSAMYVLARKRGEMPDILTDAINAVALDTIGDIIIDDNDILDEYLQTIKQHMRKA